MYCDFKNIARSVVYVPLLWSVVSAPVGIAQELGDESSDGSEETPEFAVDNDLEEVNEVADGLVASSKTVRRFHEVLDELLAEFGYDVKTGQIKGLKNLAIRKVDVR
ncbi:MAG: hypothetical protein HRU09_08290 [Oligoflexales bacterium]|nr:hypothetical protein [Oligoflexales bacterium]